MKIYKGISISVLIPSGMFEFYSDTAGRFLKFDDLENCKAAIDKEIQPEEEENQLPICPECGGWH